MRGFGNDLRRGRLLRGVGVNFDGRPSCYLRRTSYVLVAADIEPAIELFRQAIFADIGCAPDLDRRAEADVPRTGDGVPAAANVGGGSRDARCRVGLAGNRIVTGYIRSNVMM